MDDVFAFVAFKPCGCVCQAATPQALDDMMRNQHFKAEMKASRVRTVKDREEWLALPWKCEVCKPAKSHLLAESLTTTMCGLDACELPRNQVTSLPRKATCAECKNNDIERMYRTFEANTAPPLRRV